MGGAGRDSYKGKCMPKNVLFLAMSFEDGDDCTEGIRQLSEVISKLRNGDDLMGSLIDDDFGDSRDYHIAVKKNCGADISYYKESSDE